MTAIDSSDHLRPVSIAVVAEEIRIELLCPLLAVAVLVDVYGRETRLAGFTRLRAESGIIGPAARLPAGTLVRYGGAVLRLDRVEVRP